MTKLEGGIIDDGGKAVTKDAQNFAKYAALFGLQPDDLGRKFQCRGDTVEIVGLKPASPKFPVLGKKEDGKIFNYSSRTVQHSIVR